MCMHSRPFFSRQRMIGSSLQSSTLSVRSLGCQTKILRKALTHRSTCKLLRSTC